MKRNLWISSWLTLVACGGAVLPVAENGIGDSGADAGGGGGQSLSDAGAQQEGSSAHADAGCTGVGSCNCGVPMCVAGEWTCPDKCLPSCPDAGLNICLCGTPICVGGQWACPSCVPEDAGPSGCGATCEPPEVCVRSQILGGAFVPLDDAGECPAGRHWGGGEGCVQDPTYSCVNRQDNCGPTLTCGCVENLCARSDCQSHCESTTANQVNCLCQVL